MLVDLSHFFISERLHFFFEPAKIVLGDETFFLTLLESLDSIAPGGAHSHAGLFGHLLDGLHHLLATFLRQHRNRQTNHFAFDRAIEPEA